MTEQKTERHYSDNNRLFRSKKRAFFEKQLPYLKSSFLEEKHAQFEGHITALFDFMDVSFNPDHATTLKTHSDWTTEFELLFSTLNQRRHRLQEDYEFWIFCYHAASQLKAYHQAQAQTQKEQEYAGYQLKIRQILTGTPPLNTPSRGRVSSLKSAALKAASLSQIKNAGVRLNLWRGLATALNRLIQVPYSRTEILAYFDALDKLLGTKSDLSRITKCFERHAKWLIRYNVGIYAFRLLVSGIFLAKHSLNPTDLERAVPKLHRLATEPQCPSYYAHSYVSCPDETGQMQLYYYNSDGEKELLPLSDRDELNRLMGDQDTVQLSLEQLNRWIVNPSNGQHQAQLTTLKERFNHELYKEYCDYISNLMWFLVTLVTRYYMANAVTGCAITAGFLFIDLGLVGFRKHLQKTEYLIKKTQYLEELAQEPQHEELLTAQLTALENKWAIQQQVFAFYMEAGVFLALGSSAALLFSAVPVLLAASYLTNYWAMGRYLSAEAYTNRLKKKQQLDSATHRYKASPEATELKEAQLEYNLASSNYVEAQARHTLIPLLSSFVFTLSSPAGVAFVAVYLAYQSYRAYSQDKAKEQPAPEPQAPQMQQHSASAGA